MRRATQAAAVAVLAMAASPAFAGEKAMVVEAIRQGAAILPAPPGLSLAGARRLDVLPPVAVAIAAAGPNGAASLRRGFGASMTNFYPFAATGFHLSAGTRSTPRALAGKLVEPDYAALLWSPRGSGIRSTRRFSPAMLVGFDRPVADGMTLGLDGGMVMGRMDNARLGPHGHGRGGAFEHNAGTNPMARMTLGYVF
jgi:hypothetical protein